LVLLLLHTFSFTILFDNGTFTNNTIFLQKNKDKDLQSYSYMITIILAGGQGKRMNSGTTPKVLVEVYNPTTKTTHPMIHHILLIAQQLKNNKIAIVVNTQNSQMIQTAINQYPWQCPIEYIVQGDRPGTAGAIYSCISYMTNAYDHNKAERVLILSGDVPLIQLQTLNTILDHHSSSEMPSGNGDTLDMQKGAKNTLLYTAISDKETRRGNGRIVFNNNHIEKIVEEKECTEEQRNIPFVNGGIYAFSLSDLLSHIDKIANENRAQEYYLTDLIEILWNCGSPVEGVELPPEKQFEIINVNSPADILRIHSLQN